jgi:hypothetical protein
MTTPTRWSRTLAMHSAHRASSASLSSPTMVSRSARTVPAPRRLCLSDARTAAASKGPMFQRVDIEPDRQPGRPVRAVAGWDRAFCPAAWRLESGALTPGGPVGELHGPGADLVGPGPLMTSRRRVNGRAPATGPPPPPGTAPSRPDATCRLERAPSSRGRSRCGDLPQGVRCRWCGCRRARSRAAPALPFSRPRRSAGGRPTGRTKQQARSLGRRRAHPWSAATFRPADCHRADASMSREAGLLVAPPGYAA